MHHRRNLVRNASFILPAIPYLFFGGLAAGVRVPPVLMGEPAGDGVLFGTELPDVPDEQRLWIQDSVERNIRALEASGSLSAPSAVPPVLEWPLRPDGSLTDFGYFATANFVDLNFDFPDHLLDYECGRRTYDKPTGYNHGGIDYVTWPFPWNKMDQGEVAIVAAAPGTVVFKQDGEFDRSCTSNNSFWNIVVVRHDDGSVAWYGHMRRGSVTSKPVGAAVAQGEFLGLVGSSGNSVIPHLHLELHDAAGRVVEPHEGPCNPVASWWANQRPYFDSGINKMTTGFAAPVPFTPCGEPEQPNETTEFAPGSIVYLTTYYRDERSSDLDPDVGTTRFAIYYPDGDLALRWIYHTPVDYYSLSYRYFGLYLSHGVETGVYRWEAVYHGVTYNQHFTVSSDAGRYYARCVVGCDSGRQSCDRACQEECGLGPAVDSEDLCMAACKGTCIVDQKACKDTCRAAKQAE